ncbi:MAG: hypothetical protein ACR2MG_06000 [Pyrinomonadaceae bacterium]
MSKNPKEILQNALTEAKEKPLTEIFPALSEDCITELKIVVENAESLKAVLGVTLTSIVYKIYKPEQDIRFHQENMPNGYSGRTFDTKFVTPFLQGKFPHFAMAESAWLTRSLEQPHPYTLAYQGKIRLKIVKSAFLSLLNRLQIEKHIAPKMLAGLLALMIEKSIEADSFLSTEDFSGDLTISKIVEAVNQHFRYKYKVSGAARLPVLAIYAVYELLIQDVKRYDGKKLAPLETHTAPDSRSQSLGDIEVLDDNTTCFEAIEIKHLKPITTGTIGIVYRKIKDKPINRYYILTTNEPNVENQTEVSVKLFEMKKLHSCQIIVNGVLPSLKYYLRLVSEPKKFIEIYTKHLEAEYNRASAIKSEHLKIWREIRQNLL